MAVLPEAIARNMGFLQPLAMCQRPCSIMTGTGNGRKVTWFFFRPYLCVKVQTKLCLLKCQVVCNRSFKACFHEYCLQLLEYGSALKIQLNFDSRFLGLHLYIFVQILCQFSGLISHGDLGLVHHTRRQLNSCLTQPASSHTQHYCQIYAATSIGYSKLVTIFTYSTLLSDIRHN